MKRQNRPLQSRIRRSQTENCYCAMEQHHTHEERDLDKEG